MFLRLFVFPTLRCGKSKNSLAITNGKNYVIYNNCTILSMSSFVFIFLIKPAIKLNVLILLSIETIVAQGNTKR